jgi:hypothetical protein
VRVGRALALLAGPGTGWQPRELSTGRTMTTATLTILVTAILIVGAIAWNTFGGRRDLDRRRD